MPIICAKIIQNHASASHLICICLDFYLNKIEIEIEIEIQSWKATATNRMYSSDLTAFGKKCCYVFFLFHSDV